MKKHTQKRSVPQMYSGLTLTKEGTDSCIVVDKQGQVFRFDSKSQVTIVKQGIHKQWDHFNQFDDDMDKNHAEFMRLHDQVFRATVPRDTDVIEARVYLWKALLRGSNDRRLSASMGKDQVMVDGRKSTIATSRYFLGPLANDQSAINGIKTPQARACFRILCEALAKVKQDMQSKSQDLDEVHVPSISEAELRKIIVERAGELHTRQDPWRIFQYYRPVLMADKLVRREN